MPRPEEKLITALAAAGVDFTASLPCEKIKTLLEMIGRAFPHLSLTREEEGVGISAGAALAGRRPTLFVQSSGIGNMINALLSLTQFYELPLALFVSRRGIHQEKIEAQFPMGRRLPAILSGAGISHTAINSVDELSLVEPVLAQVYGGSSIHAFLLNPAVWEGSDCRGERTDDRGKRKECGPGSTTPEGPPAPAPLLTRYEIIKVLAPHLDGRVVVSNLGWPSKELYAVKHQPSNFYMLGSMGMAMPIGLGIALNTKREVVVIDGDGSLLMNPGTLATAAGAAPANLTIIAIDNSAYGSTGNQPTLTASCVDLEAVARGFGFRNTMKASSREEITAAWEKRGKGPMFVHVLALPGNKDVPNIPVHHLEIKRQVQEFLRQP